MPFEIIETITKKNAPPEATISYMPNFQKPKPGRAQKGDRKPALRITLPTTICGVSKSKMFFLQIGTGADAGKIRIAGEVSKPFGSAKAPSEGFEPAQLQHVFRWNFGFVPKMGDDHFDGEKRPVRRITDEVFEIDVPADWFAA